LRTKWLPIPARQQLDVESKLTGIIKQIQQMAQILRVVFAISIGLGSFWVVGLVNNLHLGFDVSYPALFIILLVAAFLFLVILPAIFWPRMFLLPEETSLLRFAASLTINTLIGFVCLVPLFLAIGWISLLTSKGGPGSQAGIFVTLMALWLPLWWAPGVGAFLTWFRNTRKKKSTFNAAEDVRQHEL
jgi:hypothetical protein